MSEVSETNEASPANEMSDVERVVMFFRLLKCRIGKHRYNRKFVGLLFRQCNVCGKNIHVCTPLSYRPSIDKT